MDWLISLYEWIYVVKEEENCKCFAAFIDQVVKHGENMTKSYCKNLFINFLLLLK